MSYEGYTQVLCMNGHYSVRDCYDFVFVEEKWRCRCGAEVALVNEVDDTNCDSFGIIDVEQFRISEPKAERCKECGQHRIIGEAVYRIPSEEEWKNARCHRPGYGNSPLIPIHKLEEEE